MQDSSAESDIQIIQRMRGMTIEQRAERFFDFWDFNRELMSEGVRLRNLNASAKEQRDIFKRLCYEMYKSKKEIRDIDGEL